MAVGDKRMTWQEVTAEMDWLLGGGVSPALLPSLLGRSLAALERLCRAHGREDLAAVLWPEMPKKRLSPEAAKRKRERAKAKQAA